MEIYIHTETCTQMFLTGLLITEKRGNNPNFIIEWTGKQIVVYTYNEILFYSKKEWSTDTNLEN